jgi:hypothetical protein
MSSRARERTPARIIRQLFGKSLQTNGGWSARRDADLAAIPDGENVAIETVRGPKGNNDALIPTRYRVMQQPERVADETVIAGR